jgi:negative regulator of flagellin synthesis FlgM
MTDPISKAGPLAATYATPVKTRSEGVKAPVVKATAEDTLEISSTSQQLQMEPGFDAAKVESIKKAISEGNYPLDPKKMAQSFAALEKMINSSFAPESGIAQ